MEEKNIFFYKGNVEKKVSEQFIQSELANHQHLESLQNSARSPLNPLGI